MPGDSPAGRPDSLGAGPPGDGLPVLLVDHQDCFVHTLAGYFAEHGARSRRCGPDSIRRCSRRTHRTSWCSRPALAGPPTSTAPTCSAELDARAIPAFGVCLGLQAMVEHAGGTLSLLATPSHGKPGTVRVTGGELLAGLPERFTAARYHSLHATPGEVRGGFEVTALTADDAADGGEVVMAIEHTAAGRWAVQFHPESILSAGGRHRAAGRRQRAAALPSAGRVEGASRFEVALERDTGFFRRTGQQVRSAG